jgi:hypothetical protein
MYFCIRDDDTSYFTSPDELERAYGEVTNHGPVSLAIIPFCRAGTSRGLPEKYRERWSIHPLGDNKALVEYLRKGIKDGRYEAMLHGYHHDERGTQREFMSGSDLTTKVREGKRYLEDLLHTNIRVFVPPHNAIGRRGLEAIIRQGLHLGGVAGLRSGWSWLAPASLRTWWSLRRWRMNGHAGIPWVLDLVDHKELFGNAITPLTAFKQNLRRFEEANTVDGVFCAATHYWEFDHPTEDPESRTVRDHLRKLIQLAISNPRVSWQSVGTILTQTGRWAHIKQASDVLAV